VFLVFFFCPPPVISAEEPGVSCQTRDILFGFHGLVKRYRAFSSLGGLVMRGRIVG